jgi:hypothetical protein
VITLRQAFIVSTILVVPLWLMSDAIGYGPGFDRPALPVGAKAKGPSTKGTLVYNLVENGTKLLASFDGKCGGDQKTVVKFELDVTEFSSIPRFQNDSGKQVEDFVEGFFLDANIQGTFGDAARAFLPCYPNISPFLGVVVSSTNTVAKTRTLWVANATIHAVYQ